MLCRLVFLWSNDDDDDDDDGSVKPTCEEKKLCVVDDNVEGVVTVDGRLKPGAGGGRADCIENPEDVGTELRGTIPLKSLFRFLKSKPISRGLLLKQIKKVQKYS